MSFKNEKYSHLIASKSAHEDIKFEKKDVVERFLGILWKKEVEFKYSIK